jgi:uncharacterized C2H2 Zn-finger protein
MDSTSFHDFIAPNDYYQFALSYFNVHYPHYQHNFLPHHDPKLITPNAANGVHHEPPEPPMKQIKLRCEECMITYSSLKRYENHIEKHHTKKNRHRCSFCRSSFRRRARLMNHCFKTHPEKFQDENVQQKQSLNSQIKPSIFHNIELLAQSDCKDSSSSNLLAKFKFPLIN